MHNAARVVAQLAKPDALLIFRNTPFGHKGCSQHKESARSTPLTNVTDAELALERDSSYDWTEFKGRNAVAEKIFSEGGFHILDAYSPTILQPDGHMLDCLHYCIPGVFTHWSRLLFAIMTHVQTVNSKHPGTAAAKHAASNRSALRGIRHIPGGLPGAPTAEAGLGFQLSRRSHGDLSMHPYCCAIPSKPVVSTVKRERTPGSSRAAGNSSNDGRPDL
eukprot:6000945-Prymnesium_polylepis.1